MLGQVNNPFISELFDGKTHQNIQKLEGIITTPNRELLTATDHLVIGKHFFAFQEYGNFFE